MTKLFLDTNIVVDLLERREPFCHDAVRLFTMAYNRQVQLVVSPMTYTTASFLLRKHGRKSDVKDAQWIAECTLKDLVRTHRGTGVL
jgi:predicted nucleic acid-binding protein